ncbi:hypothetical protein RCL1_001331 [Eukaryota sp. TZLM3-RCL]
MSVSGNVKGSFFNIYNVFSIISYSCTQNTTQATLHVGPINHVMKHVSYNIDYWRQLLVTLSMIHEYDVVKRLVSLRSQSILTDYTLDVKSEVFSVHFPMFSIWSDLLNLQPKETTKVEAPSLEPHHLLIPSVLDFCYGSSLTVDKSSALSLLKIAEDLRIKVLSSSVRRCLTTWEPSTLQLKKSELLKFLDKCVVKDFTIKYKDKQLKMHKFLLAALSPVFLEKFVGRFDTELDLSDFTDMLTVDECHFEAFFQSFYTGSIELTTENIFSICHLAEYFRLQQLVLSCEQFLSKPNSETNNEWLFSAVKSAVEAEDDLFLHKIKNRLNDIPNLHDCFPMSFDPQQLKIFSEVNATWQLKCFAHSWVAHNENGSCVWNLKTAKLFLETLNTSKIGSDHCYQILKPLFNELSLIIPFFHFILPFLTRSKKVFAHAELLAYLISSADKEPGLRLEMSLSLNNLLVHPETALPTVSFETLQAFLQSCYLETPVVWLCRILVHHFETHHITSAQMSELLMTLKLSPVSVGDVVAILKPLKTHNDLQDCLLEFYSEKVTGFLPNKEKQAQLTSKPTHHNPFQTSKSSSDNDGVTTGLYFKISLDGTCSRPQFMWGSEWSLQFRQDADESFLQCYSSIGYYKTDRTVLIKLIHPSNESLSMNFQLNSAVWQPINGSSFPSKYCAVVRLQRIEDFYTKGNLIVELTLENKNYFTPWAFGH